MANSSKPQIEKLLELKQLYEQGILTKEEMEAEKRKILGTNNEPGIDPTPSKTEQPQNSITENSEREVSESTEDSSWSKNKKYIFGGITLLLVIAGFIIVPLLKSHSDSDVTPLTETKDIVNREITLRGIINDKIGFSMQLQQKGNDIEGTEHYDSQKSDATILIKGAIDDNGVMTLYEYDGDVRAGSFNGSLEDASYYGTFANSRGENMPFSAKVLTKEDLAKEENAIKKISEKGTVIAIVDGKLYYLDKVKPEYVYECEGEKCGRIYIYIIMKMKLQLLNVS